jgi:hypothetical protein
MDHTVLGKILATVVTAAIDAGAIVTSSGGVLTNPATLGSIIQGFLSIWITHPASGQTAASAVVKAG